MVGSLDIKLRKDHLDVKLDAAAVAMSFTTGFMVPYSTIERVEVTRPEIPGLLENWLHGLHMPGFVAKGRFINWRGVKRFYWVDRETKAVLRLALSDHPSYHEVILGVDDPEGLAHEIETRRTTPKI